VRKVEVLYQLQRIDSALDRGRERLAAIAAHLNDDSALAAALGEYEAASSEHHRLHGQQQDLELEVADLREKLDALEKKLYGGSILNPKELAAMQQDAQQFRNLISSREDRLIELYDLVEVAAQRLATTSEQLEGQRAAYAAAQRELEAEREQLERTVAEQERQSASLRAESDPQALRTYASLRRTRAGLAVADVSQRTCQGCRVSLPVSEETRARTSQELVLCQSCGRILHIGL
jgi:hypothetical protein